jgi:hypothetical protein
VTEGAYRRLEMGEMRMRPRRVMGTAVLAAMVVVQFGLGGSAWAAKSRTLTESYVGGTVEMFPGSFCRMDARVPNPAQKNVGKVCFPTSRSPGTYRLRISDSGVCFKYTWMYTGVTGWFAGEGGSGCTWTSGENPMTLRKPRDAERLDVFLEGPILFNGHGGGYSCCPSMATTGKVTLTTPAR